MENEFIPEETRQDMAESVEEQVTNLTIDEKTAEGQVAAPAVETGPVEKADATIVTYWTPEVSKAWREKYRNYGSKKAMGGMALLVPHDESPRHQ